MTMLPMYGPCKFAILCCTIIHPCTFISNVLSGQVGGKPHPPKLIFGILEEMQFCDPDAPLDPQMGGMCIDDEFN